MITELEHRLGDAFREDARRARLLNPDQPADRHSSSMSDNREPARGRSWLPAVAAATTLIIVAGVALIQNSRDDAPPPSGPMESVPAPSQATTVPSSTATVAPTAPPTVASSLPTKLFTDVAPDAMVDIPSAPIDAPRTAAAVWSGTEMIAWAGEDGRDEGVAFNPAEGTWRLIAPAPIDWRNFPAVAWTGDEMIVWGGHEAPREYADGAAYNPATDTWRLLPDAPLAAGTPIAVWTGEEVVIVGVAGAAAYNPATDEWRRLADVPGGERPPDEVLGAVWTGNAILAVVSTSNAEGDSSIPVLGRYDLGTDTWSIDGDANYAALVGVPDAEGTASKVVALPYETGVPVEMLDSDGNSIESLPAVPLDRDKFGENIEALGVWAGEEAMFWIMGKDWLLVQQGPAEGWALNPETGSWRPLPGGDQIPRLSGALVVADDLVLAWGIDESSDATSVDRGIVYRAPTTG